MTNRVVPVWFPEGHGAHTGVKRLQIWSRRTWQQLNRFRRTPRGVAFDQRPAPRGEPWIGQSIVLRHVVGLDVSGPRGPGIPGAFVLSTGGGDFGLHIG